MPRDPALLLYQDICHQPGKVQGWWPTLLDEHPYKGMSISRTDHAPLHRPPPSRSDPRGCLVIITGTFFMQRFSARRPASPRRSCRDARGRAQPSRPTYHLNDPLWKQYADYLWDLTPKRFHPGLCPDPGLRPQGGLRHRFPAVVQIPESHGHSEIIADKLPVSLELGAWSPRPRPRYRPAARDPRGREAQFLGSTISARRWRWTGICVPTFVMGACCSSSCFAIHLGMVQRLRLVRADRPGPAS